MRFDNPSIPSGISPYTWSAKPLASAVASGTQIRVTDVGIGSNGSIWESDSVNWRPLNGSVVLRQLAGRVAAPVATYTGATGGAQLVIPGGNLKIPAGMLITGSVLSIDTMERTLIPSNTGKTFRSLRLGTSGAVFSGSLLQSANFGPDNFAFTADLRISVASSSALGTSDYTPRNNSTFGGFNDQTSLINTAADMFMSLDIMLNNAADTYQLIAMTVRLYQ